MREEILRMERVTYREQGAALLENFSMTIWAGEILGLVPINHLGLSAWCVCCSRIFPCITVMCITRKSW